MKFPSSNSGGGSKNYLSLKGGESVQGVLRGDPHIYHQHWTGQNSSLCSGRDSCEKCKAGEKPAFRFKLNMIIKENGALSVKVLNQGWKLYQQLRGLHESGWDLEKNSIRLSRTGTTKNDTVYNVSPIPNGTVSAAFEKQLAAVKLIDFTKPEVSDAQEPSDSSDPESDLPF